MGLANYIIKDGYFQIYYHDQVAQGNQPPTGNGASVAVARLLKVLGVCCDVLPVAGDSA